MKRFFLPILLFLTSCATMNDLAKISPSSNLNEIPLKSDKIIISTSISNVENFNYCLKKLIEFDYEITTKDRESGYILAEKKTEFDTYVKLNINFLDGNINIKPSWKAGSQSEIMASALSGISGIRSNWEPAVWYKNSSKSCVAFLEADKLAKTLNGNINYKFPDKVPFNKNADAIYN